MRSRAVIAVVVVVTVLAAGCWNRREPELIGLVIGLGVDVDEETGGYRVIAQVANPLGLGGGGGDGAGGGGQERPGFLVLSARGRTLFEAVRNLEMHISRQLDLAHTDLILFSEAAARRGVGPAIDILERQRELRLITRPLVVEGDVDKLMSLQFHLEHIGIQAISRQLQSAQTMRGMIIDREMRPFLMAVALPGRQGMMPRVKVFDGEGDEIDVTKPDAPMPAELLGGAAFRDTTMVGWLTGIQVRGLAWIANEVSRATLVAETPGGAPFSIEITDSRARLEPVIEGDEVRVKVSITAEGRIQDQHFQADYDEESAFTMAMAASVAGVIRDDIEAALQRAQELRTDVFGFGHLIYRTRPRDWARLEDRWDDDVFPTLTLDLDITARIRRVGFVLTGTAGGER